MTKPDAEKRTVSQPVEHRASAKGNTVVGYAAVFGETTDIGGFFREVIARGAFSKTLQTADVRAYYGHERARLLLYNVLRSSVLVVGDNRRRRNRKRDER